MCRDAAKVAIGTVDELRQSLGYGGGTAGTLLAGITVTITVP